MCCVKLLCRRCETHADDIPKIEQIDGKGFVLRLRR